MTSKNEHIETFARRLMEARAKLMLSRNDLSERTKGVVSASTIEKYETKKMSPTSITLISLATALGETIEYFFRPYLFNTADVKFDFRKQAKLSAKKVESIKIKVLSLLEQRLSIEQTLRIEAPCDLVLEGTVSNENETCHMANVVRAKMNLTTSEPLSNPMQRLEDHGVRIIEIDVEDKSAAGHFLFSGICMTVNGIYVIVVNRLLPSEIKRLTILHELGHLLLNFTSDVDDKQRENLCNVFANEMLITSLQFHTIFGKKNSAIYPHDLIAVQREYGITPAALMMKAKQLHVITPSRYKYFCIRMNQEGWTKTHLTQELYPQEYPVRLERLVVMALNQELISISKAAALLNTSVSALRNNIQSI